MAGTSVELGEDATLWMRRKKSKQCVSGGRISVLNAHCFAKLQKCYCLEVIDLHIFISKFIWYLLIKIEYIYNIKNPQHA